MNKTYFNGFILQDSCAQISNYGNHYIVLLL